MYSVLKIPAYFPHKESSAHPGRKVLGTGKTEPFHTIPTPEKRQDNRGVWRVREDDLRAYIDAAYEKTAERIASGQVPEGESYADD